MAVEIQTVKMIDTEPVVSAASEKAEHCLRLILTSVHPLLDDMLSARGYGEVAVVVRFENGVPQGVEAEIRRRTKIRA